MTPIHMLWIDGELSTLERLSIVSHLRNGHPVHLYTYGPPDNVPPGTTVLDAREILPESALFQKTGAAGNASWAPFSNMFRYKLLYERGGIWSDADVVCLRPIEFSENMPYFFSTERLHPSTPGASASHVRVNCTVIKAPQGSALMNDALEKARSIDVNAAEWAATGGQMLGDLIVRHGLGDAALQPNVFCPVDFWSFAELITGIVTLPANCYAVHFWNEMWRRNFFNKNAQYPPLTLYERLKAYYFETERQVQLP